MNNTQIGVTAQEIGQEYVFYDPSAAQNNIAMHAGGTEMLRVAPEGFYVRGIRVEADENEAKIVYKAFKAYLMWAELNRR
jgi:hypothetical protein